MGNGHGGCPPAGHDAPVSHPAAISAGDDVLARIPVGLDARAIDLASAG
jgi:hypothetical protein